MATGNSRFQLLNDTSINLTTSNPVLRDGELGFETDMYRMKIGNGQTPWSLSKYASDMNVVTNTVTPISEANTKMSTFISVKDPGYEAIGDGTPRYLIDRFANHTEANTYYGVSFITNVNTQTFDWVAIQKAVNNTNVQVFIPSGTYLLGPENAIEIATTIVNRY